MMAEAEYQFKELTNNNTNAVDPARGPPYKWADIQRSRKDMAVAWIRQNASAITSRYYELGDWVIIWCLYTVFRNRDGRRDNTIQQRQCEEDNPRVFNATMGK
ncbi:MAG: hypothetical protein M1814_004595 [Vezdaea aestivalis]|nr:MAG: hypothetical protein M1814_004595 [Vezdaea aestivalis]